MIENDENDENDGEDMFRDPEKARQRVVETARTLREKEEGLPGFFTTQFGPWTFDPEDLLLIHQKGQYLIPLERINSSAGLLDWIMQIQGKEWADPVDLYALLAAFRRILDPQENYCSFERDKQASGRILAQRYADRVIECLEETQQMETWQNQANAILALLRFDKPMPLSLLLESIDFSRQEALDILEALERIGAVSFDRENKYIHLTAQIISEEEGEIDDEQHTESSREEDN